MRIPSAAFPLLIISACMAAPTANTGTPIFEKGRDIRPLLERNDSLRAEAIRDERLKREIRKTAYLAMRLDEPGEECVARDPAARSCLVSVEAFNRNLETWDFGARYREPGFPSAEDAKRERAALLKSLLDEKYLETYSPDRESRDSLNRLFDSARSDRVQAFRARQGDSAYRALYARHFTRLFQGKEVRRYQVLATSDSVLADSLRREAEGLRESAASAEGAKAGKSAGPNLLSRPWRHYEEEDLPNELLASAMALRPGAIAGPIQVPYGHVFLRLHSARRAPDLGFEDAMPALISLMHATSGHEARMEEAIAAYYSRNAADFTASDTVRYRVWLMPEGMRRIGLKKEERIREDTAKVRAIVVQDALLPRVVREELDLYQPVRPGELLGPIRSLFGTWYFQPLDIRKGVGRLSLAQARPRIRQLLYGKNPLSPETSALREAEAKDRDLWKGLVGDYLQGKAREGLKPAEIGRKLERDKEDWVRNRLQIRHVEWAGYAPAREEKGKSNGERIDSGSM